MEEDEVVRCCSGYVLRNHQLMQRKRPGLWIGPHQISESSPEHSTVMSSPTQIPAFRTTLPIVNTGAMH